MKGVQLYRGVCRVAPQGRCLTLEQICLATAFPSPEKGRTVFAGPQLDPRRFFASRPPVVCLNNGLGCPGNAMIPCWFCATERPVGHERFEEHLNRAKALCCPLSFARLRIQNVFSRSYKNRNKPCYLSAKPIGGFPKMWCRMACKAGDF